MKAEDGVVKVYNYGRSKPLTSPFTNSKTTCTCLCLAFNSLGLFLQFHRKVHRWKQERWREQVPTCWAQHWAVLLSRALSSV